jgi:hypothetical protein
MRLEPLYEVRRYYCTQPTTTTTRQNRNPTTRWLSRPVRTDINSNILVRTLFCAQKAQTQSLPRKSQPACLQKVDEGCGDTLGRIFSPYPSFPIGARFFETPHSPSHWRISVCVQGYSGSQGQTQPDHYDKARAWRRRKGWKCGRAVRSNVLVTRS